MKDKLNLMPIFPTYIGVGDCPFHEEIKDEYLKILGVDEKGDRLGYLYTEHHKNSKFKRLNDWIDEKVLEFANLHLVKEGDIKAQDSWVLDYKIGEKQDSHVHTTRISCVYFLKADTNDVPMVFEHRDGALDDIRKNLSPHETEWGEMNDYTCTTYNFPPREGILLVWKGRTVRHKVDCKKEEFSPRVVMTYNYD